ncbi:GTPase HflX [Candidatus Babeliales bacterium]|nr:GTPase HflX [Candidatus Babeliales bacterium]
MATKQAMPTSQMRPKILLVGVQAPINKEKDINAYYEEFLSLVKTLGLEYDETIFLKLRSIDKSNFLTKGKLKEISDFCHEKKIDEVIFSQSLTPLQERNLEEILECTVWDREKLILEIFQNAAHTAEGKIQVEMAQLEYQKTRLAGKGIELAQQEGMIGVRGGPGETAKEVLKRYLADKYKQAKKRLETLHKSREIQRKQRLQSKLPLICLVGYTNSGKSSLLNALTKSDVLVEDKLFATLDTTTRELFIDGKKTALISDTVGFISQLPHQLIEAFKSTLDELNYASLLLHVVDISNPNWQDQISVVNKTLKELNLNKNILYVFNKIDKLDKENLKNLKPEIEKYTPHVLISAKTNNIKELLEYIKNYK